jgi:TonB family protein
LVCAATVLAQQQTLPSAPEPKPSPAPFKLPAKGQPVPPPAASDSDEKNKHREAFMPGLYGVQAEDLEPAQEFILKEYLANRLLPAIRSCWYNIIPEEAKIQHRRFRLDKKGKSGKVRVAFTLHKDGSRTDVTIEDSSGHNALDHAALSAVKECSPAPLPAAFARETLKMRFSFYYNP